MSYQFSISLDEWISRFPLESHRDSVDWMNSVSGPFDLAIVEQVWREKRKSTGLETDVFVFARGEPEFRHVTKIGGVPYRPEGKPWPICMGTPAGTPPEIARSYKPHGTPMCFLAQFCFTGSHDLVGELPGDVLLIFTEDEEFGSELHLEWYPIGISELIPPSEVPHGASPFTKAYGYICRIQEPVGEPYSIPFVCMTKIGGSPDFTQDPSELPGRFLCQLSSMQPKVGKPYPWVNQEAPIMDSDEMYPQQLCMVDMGSVYVFIDQDGSCSSRFDSY